MTDDKKTPQEIKVPDILDEIKAVEMIVKRHLLIKALGKLKTLSRQILETKEECTALLQAIGIDDKDVKRIIDFVNNLSEVQLTEEDRKRIKDAAKKSMETEKKEVQKKAEEKTVDYEQILGKLTNYTSTQDSKYNFPHGQTANAFWSSNAGTAQNLNCISNDVMLCSNDGNTLEIKL